MIGRLLGGTATSILYSAFESWLVFEHHQRGYSEDLLSSIFSSAVLGNSLVAIIAGLVAQQFANTFGFVAPFDVSLVILILLVILLVFTWSENYGDSKADIGASFKSAFRTIREDPKVLCLGLIQSLFEGSMYTFVLEWTPALQPANSSTIPHGYIFAGFMVAVMIGSSIFKLLSKYSKVESFMRPVLLVSAVSLVTPIMYPGNQIVIFAGFLVFEMCVGIFWPALSTMRSKYVPEAARATVMNFFRVPLNLIVVIILTQNLQMATIFKCCATFLLIATACQQWLHRIYLQLPKGPIGGQDEMKQEVDMQPSAEDEKKLLEEKSNIVNNI